MAHLTRLTICKLINNPKTECAMLARQLKFQCVSTSSSSRITFKGEVDSVVEDNRNVNVDSGDFSASGVEYVKETSSIQDLAASWNDPSSDRTKFYPSATDQPASPGVLLASEEYGNLPLSRERIMVDTYSMVKVFTEKGFTTQQAECITYTFTQLMTDALREERRLCVEKAALDVMREQVMAHIGALRKDMVILEKSELSDLRNGNEKLNLLLNQHKSQMIEDVNRVRNQLTLDINMERSRTKDDHTEVEKQISSLTTKMTGEIGRLETTFERYKNDIYKFIVGSIVSGLTIGLGLYRIIKPHL